MLRDNLPHTMTVERLSTSGNKELYTARPDVQCFLQPVDDVKAQSEGGAFAKARQCFVPFDANVKLKDRVTIDGVKFNVAGERTHQYGSWPHRVLRLMEY